MYELPVIRYKSNTYKKQLYHYMNVKFEVSTFIDRICRNCALESKKHDAKMDVSATHQINVILRFVKHAVGDEILKI